MQKYIVYNPHPKIFKIPQINIIEKLDFLSAYIIEVLDEDDEIIKKLCSNFSKLGSSSIETKISKAKKFISVEKFYRQNIYGNGVSVVVIDTGISHSLDFCVPKMRIKHFEDLVLLKKEPYDDNGHGTFVSGIIAGNGLLSCGEYAGVAPKCDLIVLKALNAKGEGDYESILKAMQWVVKNKRKFNIRVVCMSFGSAVIENNDALCVGANALWNNGIVVVAAGGNDGPDYNTITSPGRANKIITVGALDSLDKVVEVAPFSSRGDASQRFVKPDILAPGTNIISTSHKLGEQNYTVMSGTSVATPIIAGVCVLFCQKYPHATPDMIKSLLFKNAYDIGANKYCQGKGVFVYR